MTHLATECPPDCEQRVFVKGRKVPGVFQCRRDGCCKKVDPPSLFCPLHDYPLPAGTTFRGDHVLGEVRDVEQAVRAGWDSD